MAPAASREATPRRATPRRQKTVYMALTGGEPRNHVEGLASPENVQDNDNLVPASTLTRAAKFAAVAQKRRVGQQARSERVDRDWQREAATNGRLDRAHSCRALMQKSREHARQQRQQVKEYNQSIGRSIRATEAEWQAEASRPDLSTPPMPAAFGSYSTWAGPKRVCEQDDDGNRVESPSRPTAAFRDTTLRSNANVEAQGDPGAYAPYDNSNLAATAAFTHNSKGQNEIAARAERLTEAHATPTGGDSGGLVRWESPAPWWLFNFNRIPLRDATGSDLHGPLLHGSSAAPALCYEDRDPQQDVKLEDQPEAQDAADGSSLAPGPNESLPEERARASGVSPTAVTAMGAYLGHGMQDPRARKAECERRDAEDREAKWRAKHHRGSHVPPPTPARVRRKRPPGARNYYAILKVAPTATPQEIRKAYHKLCKEWHPDRVGSGAGHNADADKARRMFVLVSRAFEVLSDPRLRDEYDSGIDVDAGSRSAASGSRR